jgi:N-dimethylarginine dimethylaminohydrolase
MAITTQRKTVLDAVTQIRNAEAALMQASRATSDPTKLLQIRNEYMHLDSMLSQLSQTQAITDDSLFAQTVPALQQQAKSLQAEEAAIEKIVSDAQLAGTIVGYIGQAITLLTSLGL